MDFDFEKEARELQAVLQEIRWNVQGGYDEPRSMRQSIVDALRSAHDAGAAKGAEKTWIEAARMQCYRCRDGERLELVEVQPGGPDYCHSIPYSGHSICCGSEFWKKAKEASRYPAPAAEEKR